METSPSSPVRVLIGDELAVFRAGLRAILQEMPEVKEIVAEVSGGREALQRIEQLEPDLALLDVSLFGLDGLDAAASVGRYHLRTRTILLCSHVDDEHLRGALVAGAAGCLLKRCDRRELELAVRAVARGEVWVAGEISAYIAAARTRGDALGAPRPGEDLTARQREVLQLIAEGLSSKEIARRLGLSIKTVDTHRNELKQRLGIHRVASLVRYAIRIGLVRARS